MNSDGRGCRTWEKVGGRILPAPPMVATEPERGCLNRSGPDISNASELDGRSSVIPRAAAETAALRGERYRSAPWRRMPWWSLRAR